MRTPTAKIQSTRGFFALIDKSDLAITDQYKWRATVASGLPYALASLRSPRGKVVYLHRLLSGATPGCAVRFRNGNTLDCRRKNLFPTPPQNAETIEGAK